jgi:hypothetical protein
MPVVAWGLLRSAIMSYRLFVLAFAAFVSLASASTADPVRLAPGAEAVRIGTADPPFGMVELGPIEVSHGSGCGALGETGTYAGAYGRMKNAAARIGATYVKLVESIPPHGEPGCAVNAYVMRGIAFR